MKGAATSASSIDDSRVHGLQDEMSSAHVEIASAADLPTQFGAFRVYV